MSSNATVPASSTQAATSSDVVTQSTAQPTSSSNPPSSSASPTTAESPTSTVPQSSPAQGNSATPASTASSSAGNSASASSAAGASPSTSARASTTSLFTSQVQTTLLSTDSAGSVVFVTTSVPQVITTTVTPVSGGGSNSHTGVIVGAVVGGVAGLTVLALLLFCIRKRVRKDEFDGNFDPDRVVGHTDGGGGTLPHVDLAEEVTPFPHGYADPPNGSMRQYDGSPYLAMPSSFVTSGQSSPELYPSGAGSSAVHGQSQPFVSPGGYSPQVNMYGTAPVDWHTPTPGASPPPSTVSYGSSSARGAKEREALARQDPGLGLATQPELAEGNEDVVVHQDAGRAPIEESAPPPREIPPAYESIPQD